MNAKSLFCLIVSLLLMFQLSLSAKIVKVVVPEGQGTMQNTMVTTGNQGSSKTVTSKTKVVKTATTSTNVQPTLNQPVYTQAVVTESSLVQPIFTQDIVTEPTYGRKRRHV